VVDENPVVENQLQRVRQNDFFYVLAFRGHVSWRVPVVNFFDVLGDDGAFVEVVVYEMRRCSDDFNAPVVGLPVRVGPNKRGQKRMVNIDDSVRKTVDKAGRQHAHVFRQHQVLGFVDS
jgi:hypothetical protein